MKKLITIVLSALAVIVLSSCSYEVIHVTPNDIVIDASAQTVSFKSDNHTYMVYVNEETKYKDCTSVTIYGCPRVVGDTVEGEWYIASYPDNNELVFEVEENDIGTDRYIEIEFLDTPRLGRANPGHAWLTQKAEETE